METHIAIVSTGVALFVGLVGAYIGINQYKVAHAKLKLDLFEKRYAIFMETWAILSQVTVGYDFKKWAAMGTPFNNLIPQASFLFGRRIEQYLEEARDKWTDLWEISLEAELNHGTVPPAGVAKRADLTKWFQGEANGGAKKRFARYLDFEEWR